MHKLISKVATKARSHLEDNLKAEPGNTTCSSNEDWHATEWDAAPTPRQIYSYRRQRGVNLGSLFTLETWLVPSLFRGVENAKSEHDLCCKLPTAEVKRRLERHWSGFVDDGDWQWMRANGVNTVRLPISYYHFLPGHPRPEVRALMQETEYETFAPIYQAAHAHILRVVSTAAAHDIGVLIDLHGAPGAQNGEGHSGSSSGRADFFSSEKYRRKTVVILGEIADVFANHDNVVGIELLNEPVNHQKLPGWYAEAVQTVAARHGSRFPLYLGDCWQTEQYAELLKKNKHLAFLVMDHHLYRCFTPGDHGKSAAIHAAEIAPQNNGPSFGMLRRASENLGGNLVVGEWSAALHHTSLTGKDNNQRREEMRSFALAQLQAYEEVCAGFFFWTLKKEGPSDAGWCLYSAIEQGVLPSGLRSHSGRECSPEELIAIGEDICRNACEGHARYWAEHGNGQEMHHERYRDGFRQLWKDCMAFFSADRSTIGFGGRWIEQRAKAHSSQYRPDRSWDSVEDAREADWESIGNGTVNEWEFVHGAEHALMKFKEVLQCT